MDNQTESKQNHNNDGSHINTKEQRKDGGNKQNDIKSNHAKKNSLSQQKDPIKNKQYETVKNQQEYISRNLDKYKQIFDSNFLNEGETERNQQIQLNQPSLVMTNSSRNRNNNINNSNHIKNNQNNGNGNNQQQEDNKSDQKGKKPQFQYKSQGDLSPLRKNEISIIQPIGVSTGNYYHHLNQIQMTSNNDLSTTFIPKNIFEDVLANQMSNSTTANHSKNKKVSSNKLDPIDQQPIYRENKLSDEQLRIQSRNSSILLNQQKLIHLGNIKLNQDISYFKEQKDSKLLIDSSTITNTHILKNPASLFYSSSDQKKSNMYSQMFEHSSNKEKYDTSIASIKSKVIQEEIRKSQSQHNMPSQNVSQIINQSNSISKKPSQQNLTQNISMNNIDHKSQILKRSLVDLNSNRQLQPLSQNVSIHQNSTMIQNSVMNVSQNLMRPNKEVLFSKPTNRNEMKFQHINKKIKQNKQNIKQKNKVIELESWLTEMIEKVELKEQMNMKDVYDQIQVIYVACMKELIRQITIQCKDRGRLLEKVWDSYLDLLSRGMQQTYNVKSGEEKEHLDEVSRIHKMYDQTIKLIEKELEKKKNETKDKTKQQEQLTDAIHYFRKKLKTYENEIKKMQQIEDELRFELEAALSENLKLKLIQGDNKISDEHNNLISGKNINQLSLQNTGEINNPPEQDIHIIKSIQHLQIETNPQKKGSTTTIKIGEKKNKVTVVSHLINFNKKGLVGEDEDDKKKASFLNQFKHQMQDKDNMSEDSEVFGEKGEGSVGNRIEKDELEFLLDEEKRIDGVIMPDIELFDIVETGVQTDEIKYTDNEQINYLIKKLTNSEVVAEAEPDLIKQSALDISHKETILAALDQCKIQVSSYQHLASMNGDLQKENTTLKTKALDLAIQLKEVEQNYVDKKRKWKKKAATYIEKIQEKDELIHQLETNSEELEQKLIKNFKQKQLISSFMGKILSKQQSSRAGDDKQQYKQPAQDDEDQIVIEEEDNQIALSMNTEDDQDIKQGHSNDMMESVDIDQQTKSQRLLKAISKYVADDINSENVENKSKIDLNKILGSLNIKSSNRSSIIDSPLNRSRKLKGSLFESKKNTSQYAKQTKRIYSQNTTAATQIIDNIVKKKNSIKSAVVPLSSIIKFFTHIYQEILKNEQGHRIPLYVSCFDILIQKHGLKSVVEDKLARIFKSVYAFKNRSTKLEMIATFIGLNNKFDEIDYYYFLLGLKYFQNINQNIFSLNPDASQIPIDKAIEFINNNFQDKLEKEAFTKLVTDIKMSSQCTQLLYINSLIIYLFTVINIKEKGIEYEMMLKKCLFYYQEKKEKTKKHIEDIFYATDLDGNDQIELYEFDLIFRYIEKKNYNCEEVEELFFEEADNISNSNGEKALSLNKFVNLCVEKNLFTEEKCKQFAAQNLENGVAKHFEELKSQAVEFKKQIKNRFLKAGKFMSEIKSIIKSLFKQINEPAPQRQNSLWVSYLLMEQESRSLLVDYEASAILQNLLPLKLQMLDIVAKRFEEIL